MYKASDITILGAFMEGTVPFKSEAHHWNLNSQFDKVKDVGLFLHCI